MPAANVLTKAALAVASLMYLDSKLYLSKDLKEIANGIKTKNYIMERYITSFATGITFFSTNSDEIGFYTDGHI